MKEKNKLTFIKSFIKKIKTNEVDFVKSFIKETREIIKFVREDLDKNKKEDEIETLRLQLAACGVAAMCNTRESAKLQRINRSNPYWTASYQDVCDAVDREMELRELYSDLIEKNKKLQSQLENFYEGH